MTMNVIRFFNVGVVNLAVPPCYKSYLRNKVPILHIRAAKWQWVVSNVIDVRTGKPVGGAPPYVVRTFGSLKVGFLGLCIASEGIRSETLKQLRIVPPLDAAAEYVP